MCKMLSNIISTSRELFTWVPWEKKKHFQETDKPLI